MEKELKAVCVGDIESLNLGFKNEITLKAIDESDFYCDRFTYHIGRVYKNGTKKSNLTADIESKSTNILDIIMTNISLVEITHNVVLGELGELESVVDLYLPYFFTDHCSQLPTVKTEFIDNISNVYYKVEFEILFVAGGGLTRYLTIPYQTKNISLISYLSNFEYDLEELLNIGKQGFGRNEVGYEVLFYDEAGYEYNVDISSVDELLSMINSVRMIKCELIIED